MTRDHAILFTARETAELVAKPADDRPLGPTEIAGRTVASLVSPGTEINLMYLGEKFPATPGYAAVFEVERVGEGVTDIRPGDRALTMGPHRATQRCERRQAAVVPEGLPAEHAVFARLMAVSMTTLVTTAARPPEAVAVTGLGPVGHLAAQVFAASGYRVLAADPIEQRRSLLRERCAVETLPSLPQEEHSPWRDRVRLVVECSGHEAAVADACRFVAAHGEVVLVGVPWRKRPEHAAFDVLHPVFHRYVTLRSGWEWELPTNDAAHGKASVLGNMQAALRWLKDGPVNVSGLGAVASPADAQRVYQDLLHRPADHFVTVFDWTRLSG